MVSFDPRLEREQRRLGIVASELAFRGTRFPAEYTDEQRAAWSEYIPPAKWMPGQPQSLTERVHFRTAGSRFTGAKFKHWLQRETHYTSQLGFLGVRRLGEQYAHYHPNILVGKAWGDRDHRRCFVDDEPAFQRKQLGA